MSRITLVAGVVLLSRCGAFDIGCAKKWLPEPRTASLPAREWGLCDNHAP
jgi:hypothetical protein